MRYLSKNKYPNIYYYDDGFSVGKGEKNYYKNLEYFFQRKAKLEMLRIYKR